MKHKKLYAVLILVCFLLTLIPVSAFAETEIVSSGSCGENVTWEFDNQTGTLTINGSGEMTSHPWKTSDIDTSIKKVIVKQGVSTIADYAFMNCKALESVVLPNSIKTIGIQSFARCNNLKEIDFPNGLESLKLGAFEGCTNLESVELLEGLVSIEGEVFDECQSLKKVILPDTLKTIGRWVFEECTSLEKIVIPNGVETIGENAFQLCDNLKEVYLPDTLIDIEKAFYIDPTYNNLDVSLTIYYTGSEEQWNTLVQNAEGDGLSSVKIVFITDSILDGVKNTYRNVTKTGFGYISANDLVASFPELQYITNAKIVKVLNENNEEMSLNFDSSSAMFDSIGKLNDSEIFYLCDNRGLASSESYTVVLDPNNGQDQFKINLTFVLVDKYPVNIVGVTAQNHDYNEGQSYIGYTGEAKVLREDTLFDVTDSISQLSYCYEGTGKTVYAESSSAPDKAGTYQLIISVPENDSQFKGEYVIDFEVKTIDVKKSYVFLNGDDTANINETVTYQFEFDNPAVKQTLYVWAEDEDGLVSSAFTAKNGVESGYANIYVLNGVTHGSNLQAAFNMEGEYTVRAALFVEEQPLVKPQEYVDKLEGMDLVLKTVDSIQIVEPISEYAAMISVNDVVLTADEKYLAFKNNYLNGAVFEPIYLIPDDKYNTSITIRLTQHDGSRAKNIPVTIKTNSNFVQILQSNTNTDRNGRLEFNLTASSEGEYEIIILAADNKYTIPVSVNACNTTLKKLSSIGGEQYIEINENALFDFELDKVLNNEELTTTSFYVWLENTNGEPDQALVIEGAENVNGVYVIQDMTTNSQLQISFEKVGEYTIRAAKYIPYSSEEVIPMSEMVEKIKKLVGCLDFDNLVLVMDSQVDLLDKKLRLIYPATAKIGATISFSELEYVFKNGLKEEIDLKKINIQFAGEGRAINDINPDTGTVTIKDDKQYIGDTITMYAYDEQNELTASAVITITESDEIATKTLSTIGGKQSLKVDEVAQLDLELDEVLGSSLDATEAIYMWAETADGIPSSAFIVDGAKKINNVYVIENLVEDNPLRVYFEKAGEYEIFAAEYFSLGDLTDTITMADTVEVIKDRSELLDFYNTITVMKDEFINPIIKVTVDNKVLTEGDYHILLNEKDDMVDIVVQFVDENGTALKGFDAEYHIVGEGITITNQDEATNIHGEISFNVIGDKAGDYQIILKVNDTWYIAFKVTVNDKEEKAFSQLVIEYPAKAKIGETVSLNSIYYLSEEGKKENIDLNVVEITFSGEGRAIKSVDTKTGNVTIMNEQKCVGDTITLIAVDEDNELIGRASILIEGKNNNSSSGGGAGNINPNSNNIGNIEVTSPNQNIDVKKSSVGNNIIKDVEDTVAKDESLQVIDGKSCSVSIDIKENGQSISNLVSPLSISVPVSNNALKDVKDVNKLTMARVTTDENGEITLTYIGGNYDAETGAFKAYINEPGEYILVENENIQKIELKIGQKDTTINGAVKSNDVAPFIDENNRTMVPLSYIADVLGCETYWDGDTRTVTVVKGDITLQMVIDEVIPGFDTKAIIRDDRTLVPAGYISGMLGANVIYVPETQEIVIVK